MRRKKGSLIPIEVSLLEAALDLRQRGSPRQHGFALAKVMKEHEGARLLTAYGTLYKALDRLETAGLLTSEWEDPLLAARDGRPRRRFYELTLAGETALAQAAEAEPGRTTPRPQASNAFAR